MNKNSKILNCLREFYSILYSMYNIYQDRNMKIITPLLKYWSFRKRSILVVIVVVRLYWFSADNAS